MQDEVQIKLLQLHLILLANFTAVNTFSQSLCRGRNRLTVGLIQTA